MAGVPEAPEGRVLGPGRAGREARLRLLPSRVGGCFPASLWLLLPGSLQQLIPDASWGFFLN